MMPIGTDPSIAYRGDLDISAMQLKMSAISEDLNACRRDIRHMSKTFRLHMDKLMIKLDEQDSLLKRFVGPFYEEPI